MSSLPPATHRAKAAASSFATDSNRASYFSQLEAQRRAKRAHDLHRATQPGVVHKLIDLSDAAFQTAWGAVDSVPREFFSQRAACSNPRQMELLRERKLAEAERAALRKKQNSHQAKSASRSASLELKR